MTGISRCAVSPSNCDAAPASPKETTAPAADTTEAPTEETEAPAGGDLSDLEAACADEGAVNLIALPDEWANYKGILESFGEKYPDISHDVASPDASSAE